MRRSLVAALAALALVTGSAASTAEPVPLGPLPRNVLPTHVALELRVDPAQPRFSGETRIDVQVVAPTQTIWMHAKDLAISRAMLTPQNGPPLPLAPTPADSSGVLKLTAAQPIAAGRARIDISYSAPFGQLQGAYRVKPDGREYVLTQMEPSGARFAFPFFDEPAFKQPWDITLIIPNDQQGVSNTRVVRQEAAGPGWKRLVFATTERLPSYLVAFAVGPWGVMDGPDLKPNAVRGRSVKLRGIAAKGQGERMKFALEHTGAIVAAEEAYFGIPYPFDKLDLLAAPDFWAGAMENAGLIVYRDSLMFVDEKSGVHQLRAFWGVHAHELAHQWFGNLVTMPWWDDLWLNEAFATWFGNKIAGQLQPRLHFDRALMEQIFRVMDQDSLASTRRLREPIAEFTDIRSAFDGITYTKGAAILGMFERYLGPDRFRDAIRGYLRSHARGHATSADLIGSIAAISGDATKVKTAFARFTDQPGVPLVHVATACEGPTPVLRVEQRRFLPVGSGVAAGGTWSLPLCVRYGQADGAHEQCALVEGAEATVELKARSCPSWVMPNADGAGYYRFDLAPADQARLEANFDKLSEREQRSYADSVDAAFSAGRLDSQAFLRAAARLALTPDLRTATAPLDRLDWMLRHAARTADEKQRLQQFVARLYGPRLSSLGLLPREGEGDEARLQRTRLVSAMVYTAKDPQIRSRLAAMGGAMLGLVPADGTPADGRLHADAAPADLRRVALSMAIEQGGASEFDALMRHLAQTQDPELRGELLAAASDARQPALLERARALVLRPDVRGNEVDLLMPKERDEPANRQMGRDWLDANFDKVSLKLSGGAWLVHSYSSGMCSAEEADTVKAKFADRMRTIEGGPRAVAQAVERVRLCAALAQAQGPALQLP